MSGNSPGDGEAGQQQPAGQPASELARRPPAGMPPAQESLLLGGGDDDLARSARHGQPAVGGFAQGAREVRADEHGCQLGELVGGAELTQRPDRRRSLTGSGQRAEGGCERRGVDRVEGRDHLLPRGFPTFIYIHTMDPHVPYTPPPPFDRKYAPFPVPGHPAADPRSDYLEPLDRERLIGQYDGDIAYGDQEFGASCAS